MNSLQGHLLAASVRLTDPNFSHTVVLLVQHGKDGALGLVLNRPTQTTVQSAWGQVSESPCAVEGVLHQGGPCPGPLMVLHASEEASQVRVIEGVHFAAEQDKIEWLMEHPADDSRVFVGYAGWGPGQLEGEVEHHAWLATPATAELVFGDASRLWERTTQRVWAAAGLPIVNPNIIPTDPSHN